MRGRRKNHTMSHLRMISPEEFAAIREHFQKARFTEEAVRQWFAVEAKEALNLLGLCTRPAPKQEVADSLDALMLLFLAGESLATQEAASRFPAEVWDALTRSQLVLLDTATGARCIGSVVLFPIRDVYLTADRWTNIDHSLRPRFPDMVYPALSPTVNDYLQYISFDPCEDFLEICAGSAPAALLASRTAKNVWATDITQRSVDFAAFNAALNGITNVKVLCGDLFQAVEDRRFDRIAAHPPFMPALTSSEIFGAGGELGEEITQRMVSELPARLKPGGRLYCRTLGIERAERSFESTIREWLGEKQAEFDVAVFVFDVVQPDRLSIESALDQGGGRDAVRRLEDFFRQRGVKEFLLSILVIQPVSEKRAAFTLRRALRKDTPAGTIEWAMRWEEEKQRPGALEALSRTKPLAVTGVKVSAEHTYQEGEFKDNKFSFSVKRPFELNCGVEPWMVHLLPQCDGKTSVSEIFELCKKNEWIHPATPLTELCGLIAAFIGCGFLQIESFRWPEAEG